MKAIEAFKDLPADAQQVAEFSRQIIEELNNGKIEPIEFKAFLNGLKDFIYAIRPTLDRLVASDAPHETCIDPNQNPDSVSKYIRIAQDEINMWEARKRRAEKTLQQITGGSNA
jgi:hypothetical protein